VPSAQDTKNRNIIPPAIDETRTEAGDKVTLAKSDVNESQDSPSIDKLINNADSQIKLHHAHDIALSTLGESIDMVRLKLDDIKPERLPSIITAASKVVDNIRRERIDAAKQRENQTVHLHFYTPAQRKLEEYEVIDVN